MKDGHFQKRSTFGDSGFGSLSSDGRSGIMTDSAAGVRVPLSAKVQVAPSSTEIATTKVELRLHQLIVDELIWIGSKAETAAKGTVQGEDHENEQPDKDGQQDNLDPLQSRILDLKKKG